MSCWLASPCFTQNTLLRQCWASNQWFFLPGVTQGQFGQQDLSLINGCGTPRIGRWSHELGLWLTQGWNMFSTSHELWASMIYHETTAHMEKGFRQCDRRFFSLTRRDLFWIMELRFRSVKGKFLESKSASHCCKKSQMLHTIRIASFSTIWMFFFMK